MPFAVTKPRCLLPLANTPLIDYTLEFLASNCIQEVYVYAGNHANLIKEHVEANPTWGAQSHVSPFDKIEFIPVADARSMGDFFRDLDKRGKMTGDFILVQGDLVANIDLHPLLAKHRSRREENRDAIMTMILRDGGPSSHLTEAQDMMPVFTLDPETGRCFAYEEIPPFRPNGFILTDSEILNNPTVELRADLIDPAIDICTPDVLALWSESFDYELPRRNFLHGVLKDHELNGKMIYTEIVGKGYAARASSMSMYVAITRDVMGRWTRPMIPECNLMPGQTYKRMLNNVSMEEGVVASNSSTILNSIIGGGSTFGDDTVIWNSVIGRRCKIGSNVAITDSFVWDDVLIEDGTRLKLSMVAESVYVGKNCSIQENSLISFGVRMSDGVKLEKRIVLSTTDSEGIHLPPDTALLGPEAKGAEYRDLPGQGEFDGEEAYFLYPSLVHTETLCSEPGSSFNSHSESDSDDEAFTPSPSHQPRSRLFSTGSDGASRLTSGFHVDAVNGILDTLRAQNASTGDFDSTKLEITGLRLATDASDHEVRRAVAVAYTKRAAELNLGQETSAAGPLEPAKAAEKTISVKGAVKFLIDMGIGGSETSKQVAFILALQQATLGTRELELAKGGTLMAAMMQQLYNADALDEDSIDAWWQDPKSREGEGMVAVRERVRVLVEWLQEAEEESDEEDEEEN